MKYDKLNEWLAKLTDVVRKTDPSMGRDCVRDSIHLMGIVFGDPSYDWSDEGLQVWVDEITNPLNS